MGKLDDSMCYVCLKENIRVHSLSENDENRMTHREKLIYCIPNSSEGFENYFICEECILLLNSAYKFLNMVKNSLGCLKMCKVEIDDVKPHCVIDSENIKTENEVGIENVDINSDYVCKICNTELKTQSLLRWHLSRIHNIGKRHQCNYCQKIFKQSWHLQDHLSTHTNERTFKCDVCEKTFLRVSSLRRHLKTHERAPGEKMKPTPFLCSVCGKKFIYSNGLQRHMRVHLGIKRHECEICKRKFSQKTHLLAHARTHTGEKPYVCDACGEAFSQNASLRKHIASHQKDMVSVKIEYNCY